MLDTIRYTHSLQASAATNTRMLTVSKLTNARDTIRYTHSLQASAVHECIITNARDTIRYTHSLQARAAIECTDHQCS